jgi:hypothetical protein
VRVFVGTDERDRRNRRRGGRFFAHARWM